MSAALFHLISTNPAEKTATYKLAGDFSGVWKALEVLTGKRVFAMGVAEPVGEVVETITGADAAKVVVKIADGLVAKKVGAGVLAAGQCRLAADGTLGSFNLVDAPLDDDQLHKAAGPNRAAAQDADPVAAVHAAIAMAKAGVSPGRRETASSVAAIMAKMDDLDQGLIRMGAMHALQAGAGDTLLKALPTTPDATIAALSDTVERLQDRLAKALARPMPLKSAGSVSAITDGMVKRRCDPPPPSSGDLRKYLDGLAADQVVAGLCDAIEDLRKRMVQAELSPMPRPLRSSAGAVSVSKSDDVSPGTASRASVLSDEDVRKYLDSLPQEERGRIELKAALSRPFQIGRGS